MGNWQPSDRGKILKTGFFHRFVHYSDDPRKDDEWVKSESLQYQGINSPKWRREMEGDWDVYGGDRIWPMLNRQFHNAQITLDKNWAIYRVIDHGIRHPTCCLWVGVNRNGDRHFFREYYATDRTIALNCKAILAISKEPVIDTYIDPSTRKRTNYISTDPTADKRGLSRLIDIYIENGIFCSLADNAAVGYDKVADGLLSQLARQAITQGSMPPYLEAMHLNQEQILLLAQKPAISFDLRYIVRAYKEIENLRWKELTGDSGEKSEPEKAVDVQDEGPDCVRYAMQSELFWRLPIRHIPPNSYLGQIQQRYLKREKRRLRKRA